jgi:cytochrome bd-type quinol oxidase subunit 2
MKFGDIVIIAGVILLPLLFGIFFALAAYVDGNSYDQGLSIFLSIASFAVAVALGLITTSILLRNGNSFR